MRKITFILIIFIVCSALYGKNKVYIGLTQPITPAAVIEDQNKILMSLDLLTKLGLQYKSKSVNTLDLSDTNIRINTYNYLGMNLFDIYELTDKLNIDYEKRNGDIIIYNKIVSVTCDNGYVTYKFAFKSAFELSYWNNSMIIDLIGSKYSDNTIAFNNEFDVVSEIAFGQLSLDAARCVVRLKTQVPNQKAIRKQGSSFSVKLPQKLQEPKPINNKLNNLKDIKDLSFDTVGKENIAIIRGGADLEYSLNENVDTGRIAITFNNFTFDSALQKTYKTTDMTFTVNSNTIITNPKKIKSVTFTKDNGNLIINFASLQGSNKKFANLIICLDPGHGGKDVGAKYNTLYEKDINYRAVTVIKEELEKRGVSNVFVTRNENEYLDLSSRGQYAIDKDCDVFISIHTNSTAGENKVSGLETYYRGFMPTAEYLGKIIHNEIIKDLPIPNKGLKKDTVLYKTGLGVLRKCNSENIPCLLIELGFINHSIDRELLQDDKYLRKIAVHIADGLTKYITAKPYNEL